MQRLGIGQHYQILAHAMACIDQLFVMQVIAGTCAGNFNDQFGRSFNVIIR